MTALRLVIFDVDGTLVDSQASILGAMQAAFDEVGLMMPNRDTVLSIVGLSLDQAMAALAPDEPAERQHALVEGYKHAFQAQRKAGMPAPLYPGALDALHTLHATPEILLGIATGKSKRGLDALLDMHGLAHMFVTQQVADFHPSKPHPSMIHEALADTGVSPTHAAMIGDTRFDMDMAQAAGVAGIGVSWGYHPADQLTAAKAVIDRFDALPQTLTEIWKNQT